MPLLWKLHKSKPPEDACMLNRFIYDVSSLQERLLQFPVVKNPSVVPATGSSEKMKAGDPPEDKGKL
ncbi:hypothetical protein FOZG_11258 [Fusarium oxysporum Fo47]|uniref:Uncharacterized protein n=1 Tax=Fusarium oxysporum Fo47 TaxID=660027 RepID=W9K1E4_FUSOX|nr:hypothetical protein FOZG_11258 [Fusarium oxysporum Fo47]